MSNSSIAYSTFSVDNEGAHRRWVKAGFIGSGRIVVEDRNLSGARLAGGCLVKIRLIRCDLQNSVFASCNFTDAELIECVWDKSNLYGSKFDKALLKNCRFIGVHLEVADFIEAQIEGGDWSQSNFDTSLWTGAVVRDACFQKANLLKARLHKAHFINCDFRGADFLFAQLFDAVFEHCDFRGANLKNMRLRSTTFIKCGFSGCYDTPQFEGPYQIIEPDLSEAFDGSEIVDFNRIQSLWENNPPVPLPPESEKIPPQMDVQALIAGRRQVRMPELYDKFDSKNLQHRRAIIEAIDILIEKYIIPALGVLVYDPDDGDNYFQWGEFDGFEPDPVAFGSFLEEQMPDFVKPKDEELKNILDFAGMHLKSTERRDAFYLSWSADRMELWIAELLLNLTKDSPPSPEVALEDALLLERLLQKRLSANVSECISKAVQKLRSWASTLA